MTMEEEIKSCFPNFTDVEKAYKHMWEVGLPRCVVARINTFYIVAHVSSLPMIVENWGIKPVITLI